MVPLGVYKVKAYRPDGLAVRYVLAAMLVSGALILMLRRSVRQMALAREHARTPRGPAA